MKKLRVRLSLLMVLVALVVVGLALIKVATDLSSKVVFGFGLLGLLIATLGAFIRRQSRAEWIGFTLFGWVYAVVLLAPPLRGSVFAELPGRQTFYDVVNLIQPALPEPVEPPGKAPSNTLWKEDSSGWHFQKDGRNLELTTKEWKAWAAYLDRRNAHDVRSDAAEAAGRTALTFLGLTFAVMGSAFGLILNGPNRIVDRPKVCQTPGSTD